MSTPDTTVDWASEPDVTLLLRARAMLKTESSQALHDLEKLADHGSLMSMVYIAWAYSNGEGLHLDLEQAEAWYRRAVDGGSILASLYLGTLYGKQRKFDQEIEAYSIGVIKDFPPSIYRLGWLYFMGYGVDRDLTKARELWERASKLGHVRAKRYLGLSMMQGKYGILEIPRGAVMLISLVGEIWRIISRDPQSDLLR